MKELLARLITEYFKKRKDTQYFANIGISTEDVFDWIDYHDNYINLYPNFDEYDNEYGEDYYFPSEEDAYNYVNDALALYNNLPNPLTIYRTIKVKSLNDINYDYLGDSWSYDKQSAINFANNHGGGNVLLIGETTFDNIDWEETIKLHFQFSTGMNFYDENEVNIIDSDKITNVKAEKLTNLK